jgi:hypothetical protein
MRGSIFGAKMSKKILVGFTAETSAIWPKFFCPLFRHSVVLIDGALIQVGIDRVRAFPAGRREIAKLEKAGWIFIEASVGNRRPAARAGFLPANFQFLTCVGFAKRALGIHAPFVWTPDQLFMFMARNAAKF